MIKQISIFLENKAGRLAAVTKTLGQANINIRALSIADTTEFGILRLIVDRPDDAYQVLKDAGYSVTETDVLAIEVPDVPGGLAQVLEVMGKAEINVEYLYGFLARATDDAIIIFRVESPEAASILLSQHGFTLLSGATVYSL